MNPLVGHVITLMYRDLVPVHFAVDGQAIVSVAARGLGSGGGEPQARVMTLCPLALITFPSINYIKRKNWNYESFFKVSPSLINGISRTIVVKNATKVAMS